MTGSATPPAPRPRGKWKQDPKAVKEDILRVARREFAEHGLSGARVQEIAEKTKTSKRMIFYYFKDKESLYREVFERAYQDVRKAEQSLALEDLEPEAALRKLIAHTFNSHRENEEFIRLVMIENIHRASHLKGSETILVGSNSSAVEQLRGILERGKQQGVFRSDVDPLQLHWKISAFCFFNVSNQPTFSHIIDAGLSSEEGQAALREDVLNTLMGSVLA